MRIIAQRVTEASVSVGGATAGAIGRGLAVLLGVEKGDSAKDAAYMADKVAGLRVFEDAEGKMNLSVSEVGGAVLAVSQFTLLGDVRKGKRPSFTEAAPPEEAEALCAAFAHGLRSLGIPVEEGVFRADMLVKIWNDGPVTIMLDSRKRF